MYRQLLIFLIAFGLFPAVHSQEQWEIDLLEISINERPLIDAFSSDSINSDLILSNFSPFYRTALNFREYSPGGISIFSVRGSTAQQNAVFWNGFKIENQMLGLTDINLFPGQMFDQIYINTSTETSRLINGKPGGTIHFNSRPQKNEEKLIISAFLDNNRNSSYQINTNLKAGSTLFSIRALSNQFSNRYSYLDLNNKNRKAEHAKLNQNSIIFSIIHQSSSNWKMSYDLWAQNTERQIPPTIFQQRSEAEQTDRHFRNALVLQKSFDKGVLELRTAFLAEQLIYSDSLIQEFSNSRMLEWQSRLSYSLSIASLFPIKVESGLRNIKIRSDAYDNTPHQSPFFLSFSGKSGDLFSFGQLGIQLKQEFNRDYSIPLTYQFQLSSMNKQLLNWFITAGNHYRLPTFNDLYWPGSGNKQLFPENGYQFDGSIQINHLHPLLKQLELTGFYRKTNNLIFWNNRQGSWRPENLSTVKARGFEFRWHTEWMISEVKVLSKLGYDFVLSELTKDRFPNDAAINKQLPYIPKHSFILENVFQYRDWQLSSHFRSLSTRYTNTDHSSSLEPNHLLDISISKSLDLNFMRCNLSLSVYNATNKSHFSVANRPLPLRSFGLGAQIFIH
ncbi:MAG: TonB-dependent receptor [Saprospirales bacterium]|nr:MAG: TonB-dependent receptor [Saprospirales bacterium]